jgi:hypothetical protein
MIEFGGKTYKSDNHKIVRTIERHAHKREHYLPWKFPPPQWVPPAFSQQASIAHHEHHLSILITGLLVQCGLMLVMKSEVIIKQNTYCQ